MEHPHPLGTAARSPSDPCPSRPSKGQDDPPGTAPAARGFAELAEQAVACVPGSCAAAVTLTDPAGGPLDGSSAVPGGAAAAATHPEVAELVAAQWESGEGPVPSALESGRPVLSVDVPCETRWPRFRAMALQRGLRASAAWPYRHDGAVLTLSVYAFRPEDLAGVAEEGHGELAALAEAALRESGRRG